MFKWGREIQTVNKMLRLGFRDVISLEYTGSKKFQKIQDYVRRMHTTEDKVVTQV